MPDQNPLYLGFDLSTQAIKGVAIDSTLTVRYSQVYEFDTECPGYGIKKGVLVNEAGNEVFAPVKMWLEGLDTVLTRLKADGLDFARVKGVSGAGMQHGSVYWSHDGVQALGTLELGKTLAQQMDGAFSWPYSPNWQDASTQSQCDEFDAVLGSEQELARVTGSKAHHRFTGPQILRFRQKHPEEYSKTARISLVSSSLASIFLGKVASIDIADVCGMNLWDVEKGAYDDRLLALASGSKSESSNLAHKLGDIETDGGASLGNISSYFVDRYKFSPSCNILPFTGDNPSTILALPLRPLDAIVSLGTSTTFLMSTPIYRPDPAYHFMTHPTTPGLHMFMLCYKNGSAAREQVRDNLSSNSAPPPASDPWQAFNAEALTHPPMNAKSPSDPHTIYLNFPRPEIVPNVPNGEYNYTFDPNPTTITTSPHTDSNSITHTPLPSPPPPSLARSILESQLLSLRLRSQNIVTTQRHLPAQPRRIYLVGGGSHNPAIARLAGEILGGTEGVWKLDVGGNACAMGSAYKAAWACERKDKRESFEKFIGERWREEDFARKVDEGFRPGVWERYKVGVEALGEVEKEVVRRSRGEGGEWWKGVDRPDQGRVG